MNTVDIVLLMLCAVFAGVLLTLGAIQSLSKLLPPSAASTRGPPGPPGPMGPKGDDVDFEEVRRVARNEANEVLQEWLSQEKEESRG